MTTTLIVSALGLLLLGTIVGVRAARAARARHWLGGTVRGLVALLLLALAALAATVTVGLQGYRAFTFEEVAATRPATFEVRVSTTGLLARPAPSRLAP